MGISYCTEACLLDILNRFHDRLARYVSDSRPPCSWALANAPRLANQICCADSMIDLLDTSAAADLADLDSFGAGAGLAAGFAFNFGLCFGFVLLILPLLEMVWLGPYSR